MTASKANETTCELPLIYMNGSKIPLTGHELVASLHHQTSAAMLMAIALLLAMPSGGVLLGDAPLWSRIILNVTLVGTFLGLFPALLTDAMERARRAGKGRVHLLVASVPAAILSVLSTEAIGIILLGGSISRWALLAKLGFGIVCFELVLLIVAFFYGPVIVAENREQTEPAQPTVAIGTLQILPHELRRIETEGRHLHLYLQDDVRTVTARMRDVMAELAPYGLLVHRCHWVAFGQVGPISVKGRSYEMTTTVGDRVPVSRERRKVVESLRDGFDAQ